MKKAESPAGKQGQSVGLHKGSKARRKSQIFRGISDTSREAYAATEDLRQTETIKGRVFFLNHPSGQYCRADLSDLLDLPINHITRLVSDLLDENFIEESGDGTNPRSGRTVQMLRLKRKEGEV